MGNVTSTLTATVTAVDVNSKQPITRDLGSPSLNGAVGRLSTYQNLATAALDVALELPAATVYCVYVKNLNASGGGNLTVKGTPTGLAEVTLAILPPGGIFVYWSPSTNGGYTTLKLNPAANNTPFEYYLGA